MKRRSLCSQPVLPVLLYVLGAMSGLRAQTNSVRVPSQKPEINQVPLNTNQSYNSQIQNSLYQQNNYFYANHGRAGSYTAAVALDSAAYYADKAPLRAIELINRAVSQSITEQDRATECSAYLILGNIQQGLQQHELAVENYLKCLQLAEGKYRNRSLIAPETLFEANKHLAVSYLELGELGKADLRINYSLGYASVAPAALLSAKRVLASIRARQGRAGEAESLLTEVLSLEKRNQHIRGEAETYLALGELSIEQKNDAAAIEYLNHAKEASEKGGLAPLALKANDQLAKIFRRQKNLAKEVEARNGNISINTSFNNSQAVIKENLEIGNAYLQANNMESAQLYLEKGLNGQVQNQQQAGSVYGMAPQQTLIFLKSNDLEEAANAYKLLAQEYLKKKDPAKALLYFNNYAALQDSIRRVRQRELTEAMSLSTSLGKNQQKIELLEKERRLSEQSMDVLRKDKSVQEKQLGLKNTIIGVLAFCLCFMLMAGFFVIRSYREKRRANLQLALRSLRGQMNPHFIFNALNSVNHYISQNDERKANRYLSDFSKLMRMVMDSSKHSLVPLRDELDMLRLYLQLEHTRFNDKFDYTIRIGEGLEDRDFELPPMLVQPYLENAIWHGLRYLDEKGTLTLSVDAHPDGLQVIITDNGIGREQSRALKTHNQKKQASIGMQNIENRIEIMNDLFSTNIRVAISDALPGLANCGTTVSLIIPQTK